MNPTTTYVISPRPAERSAPKFNASSRRISLDVLRGFLLWNSFLMDSLVAALIQVPASDIRNRMIEQYTHTDWNGLDYVDAGFPAYIILMGAAMALSYQRRTHAGATKRQLLFHVLQRSILLWIFSFFFEGGFSVPLPHMNFTDIFYELAVCILATGVMFLTLSGRAILFALAAFLLAHWAILTLIPVPGYGFGDFSKAGNVESYLRSTGATAIAEAFRLTAPYDGFADHIMWYAMLPKLFGTCLIGLILGQILTSDTSHQRQTLILAALGSAVMALGWIWDSWLPINKHLWTPSYTIFTGGMTFVSTAAVIQIAEVWKCRRFALVFTAFGCHSLLAWTCFFLLPFDDFARRLIGLGFPPVFGAYQPVAIVLTQVMLCWCLFAWWHTRQSRMQDVRL